MGILDEIFENRGRITPGGNPKIWAELYGADIVEVLFYEPDPQTFRGEWYYNSRINKLFRKVRTESVPFWKQVSSY